MEKKIGQLIQARVKSEKMNVTDFAKAIDIERSNAYDIFKRDSIDTKLLKKIGQVLHYDFFQYFLEPDTIKKIIVRESVKTSKIFIQLDYNEDEIMKIGFEDKLVQILKK